MKKILAGVDEVGRGSLVGPVFAAAVIFIGACETALVDVSYCKKFGLDALGISFNLNTSELTLNSLVLKFERIANTRHRYEHTMNR